MGKDKERNYACDVIRIVATYIVVATHVKLAFWDADSINNTRLLIACLFGDGVSIFFILSGFFMFDGSAFSSKIRKCILSIALPALLVAIMTQFIYPWICSGSILGGITFDISWKDVGASIIQQNAGNLPGCFHFWYIFSYIKWILFYPLLKWICQEGREQSFCRWLLIILQVVAVLANNVKLIYNIPLNVYSLVDTSILLGTIGFEIRCNKNVIKGNFRIRIASLIIFMGTNFFRFVAQKKLYSIDINNGCYINWDSIFGIVGATAIFCFIYSWGFDNINTRVKNMIMFISNRTFTIYLFHVIIYFKCSSIGLQDKFIKFCSGKNIYFVDLVYSLIYPLFIFIITLIISILLYVCINAIKCKVRQSKAKA